MYKSGSCGFQLSVFLIKREIIVEDNPVSKAWKQLPFMLCGGGACCLVSLFSGANHQFLNDEKMQTRIPDSWIVEERETYNLSGFLVPSYVVIILTL